MVEVLQERGEQHVWQLLLPALAQAVQSAAGPVVLVAAPFEPFGPSLAARPAGEAPAVRACGQAPPRACGRREQALRCADVAAVLAWLPQARSAELRRLHMAAQQHGKLLFVFRGLRARNDSLRRRGCACWCEAASALNVHILKRRGPPLEAPVVLPARAPAARWPPCSQRAAKARPMAAARRPPPSRIDRRSHGLDRAAALA